MKVMLFKMDTGKNTKYKIRKKSVSGTKMEPKHKIRLKTDTKKALRKSRKAFFIFL